MHIAFPYRIDALGRTTTAPPDGHIRDLIEQVLFTTPGERVNRPTFGSGLLRLVFAPTSDLMATAMQASVQAALQQWLDELILVEAVLVEIKDAALLVTIQYVVRRSQERSVAQFSRAV